MATSKESILRDEISVLEAIYLPEELEVKGPNEGLHEVAVMLHPYTADKEDEKYVCMQLVLKIDTNYPFSKPSFDIKMPRGISDNQLNSILMNLDGLASHKLGEEMLFTLIEYAKECLTNNNRPECPCAICLDLFEEDDNFIRTECFHFFHDACIARYVAAFMEQIESTENESHHEETAENNLDLIPCPVCRTPLDKKTLKIDGVDTTKTAKEEMIAFEPSKKFLAWREKMKYVFQRQKKRGGIIDIEAERNKFLIETKEPENRKTEAKSDDVEELEYNESRKFISGIEEDHSAVTVMDQTLIRKSMPGHGDMALNMCRNKYTPRKEYDRSSNGQDRDYRKPQDSRRYRAPPKTKSEKTNYAFEGQKRKGERKAARTSKIDSVDTRIDERTRSDGHGERATDYKPHQSLKSQERKTLRPPPGFKPLT